MESNSTTAGAEARENTGPPPAESAPSLLRRTTTRLVLAIALAGVVGTVVSIAPALRPAKELQRPISNCEDSVHGDLKVPAPVKGVAHLSTLLTSATSNLPSNADTFGQLEMQRDVFDLFSAVHRNASNIGQRIGFLAAH